MKKRILQVLAGVCILGVIMSIIVPELKTKAANVAELGSILDFYSPQGGTYNLKSDSRFYIIADTEPSEEVKQTVQLASRQLAADGYPSAATLEILWGPESGTQTGDIVVEMVPSTTIGKEGYILDVTTKAKVKASDVDGLLYGFNMLQKCFKYERSLQGFLASDTPDTKERTVMLDCGRKYYTKEWICNFIRQISWMGYNTLELHFSDDGGFRADFWGEGCNRGTYQPANDFSWLCGSQIQHWVKYPYLEDPDKNRVLSTAELVEICETAKEYHIEIIPSFDSPAHMDYITWRYENYAWEHAYDSPKPSFIYNGTKYEYMSAKYKFDWGYQWGVINYFGTREAAVPTFPDYTTLNIKDDTAKAFVFALYADIAQFFKEYAKSENFNIGGDEINIYENTWQYEDLVNYINDLNDMLREKDYTCRMFNDMIGSTKHNGSATATAPYGHATNSGFNKNIEIVYWNSPYNPNDASYYGEYNETRPAEFFWKEGANKSANEWGDGGRTIYNGIQTSCYYVLRQKEGDYTSSGDARNENNREWPFYYSTEDRIYNYWTPVNIGEVGDHPETVPQVDSDHLGGAYFLIWNDYAAKDTEEEVWVGAKDDNDPTVIYSLFDRMWSNIIKMQNSDINNNVDTSENVTYDQYVTIRNKFGYFPGYNTVTYNSKNQCSQGAKLPEAKEVVKSSTAQVVVPNGLSVKMPYDCPIKIAQFADLHFGEEGQNYHNNREERTKEYMQYIVDTQKPDLIVCSGDNIMTTGLTGLQEFIELMESYKIPWTMIFGNHDAEGVGEYGRQSTAEYLENCVKNGNTKYLLYSKGYVDTDATTNRYGNFSISVLNEDGTKLLGAVILLDGGTYNSSIASYDSLTTGQISWYESEIDTLDALYDGEGTMPSIVFSHIQLPEHYEAYTSAKAGTGATFVFEQEMSDAYINNIRTGGPTVNTTGFFESMKTKGSSKAFFCGHAHLFDFQVKMDGIVLGFGPQTGFSTLFDNNDMPRKTYIYNLAEDFSFTTTACVEPTDDLGLSYTGTFDSDATYDETTGTYVVTKSFNYGNYILFSYNGVRLTTENTTITGDFSKATTATYSGGFYSSNGATLKFDGTRASECTFTYNPTENTLNIEVDDDDNTGGDNTGGDNTGDGDDSGTTTTGIAVTILLKTKVNGTVKQISEIKKTIANSEVPMYLKPRTGYKYESIEGGTFKALASNDGSGYVYVDKGTVGKKEIIVWYENVPDDSRLKRVLAQAPFIKDEYTTATWTEYKKAYDAAKQFEITPDTIQKDIDDVLADLEKAMYALTMEAEGDPSIISVRALADSTVVGKEIGFVVYTTTDVTSLSIVDAETGVAEELTFCSGRIQYVDRGIVKVWLVNAKADTAGNFKYQISATVLTDNITNTTITSTEVKEIKIK